jgi:hypothetical protein
MNQSKTGLLKRPLLFTLATLLVVALGMLAPVWQRATAAPTSVGLLYFIATPLNNAVALQWETATELGTAGFIIKRSAGGPFVTLENIGFIEAEGGPTIGYTYTAEDETAVNGQTYTYKLFEVEINATEVELATQTVTVGPASPTPTPTATTPSDGSGSPTNTPPPDTATNTPPPTETLIPNQTPIAPPPSPTGAAPPTQATASPTVRATASATVATAPSSGATTSSTSLTGPQVAQAQAQPTTEGVAPSPDTGYPGPADDNEGAAVPPPEEGYPPEQPASTLPQATAVVGTAAATQNGLATPVPIIGDQPINGGQSAVAYQPPAAPAPAESQAAANGTGGRALLYLWGGFLAALILFGSSMLGSIILFTRKFEGGR